MKSEKNVFLSYGQENDFPSILMVYCKISGFVYNFYQNYQMLPNVYGLSSAVI